MLFRLPTPIDLSWDDAGFARLAKRLDRFGRTVWCESRGVGASGGDFLDTFVVETLDADLTAVLDGAHCEQVVLFGTNHAGPPAIRYTATHLGRVAALVLVNTFAHYVREDDYPFGFPSEGLDQFSAAIAQRWGAAPGLEVVAPSRADDDRFRAWWARCLRLAVSPEETANRWRVTLLDDVRPLLPTLTVPTLVLHRLGDRFIRVGAGRYLAENIPGAKYVELPGDDHLFFVGDTDALCDEIEEFLTGSRTGAEGEVVTATILFTDIVASTEQAARMGHRKWATLTEEHDAMVRGVLKRHRGREIKTTGDGFLATFDATTRAIRAATEIVTAAERLGINVRAGVHTGEVEFRPNDVAGLAVSIGKRVCDLAGPGQVLVTEMVRGAVVGSGIGFEEVGGHTLKGVPGEWRLYEVTS